MEKRTSMPILRLAYVTQFLIAVQQRDARSVCCARVPPAAGPQGRAEPAWVGYTSHPAQGVTPFWFGVVRFASCPIAAFICTCPPGRKGAKVVNNKSAKTRSKPQMDTARLTPQRNG